MERNSKKDIGSGKSGRLGCIQIPVLWEDSSQVLGWRYLPHERAGEKWLGK